MALNAKWPFAGHDNLRERGWGRRLPSGPASPYLADADGRPALAVMGAGIVLFIDFGVAYAMPAFFAEVSGALAISARYLSALFSATGALYFLFGMVSGPISDRIGPRRVIGSGLLMLALGLVAVSLAQSELAFEASCFIGIGIGVGLTFVPVIGAVQRACRSNPTVAGGIAASGIGAGTLVLPPFAHLMIGYVGWREAAQILAVVAAIGILAALAFVGRGEWSGDHQVKAPVTTARPVRVNFLSPRPILLYVAQLSISVVAFVPFAHLVPFAQAAGWRSATGVWLISLIGAGGIGGRLLIGFVARRLGACCMASLCALIMAISLVGFILLQHPWMLGAVAVLYGLGYGGATGLLGPAVAEVFGNTGICRSVGWVTTSRAIGILIGPWAVGLIAYQTGGYAIPFLICAIVAMGATFLFAVLHCFVDAQDNAKGLSVRIAMIHRGIDPGRVPSLQQVLLRSS